MSTLFKWLITDVPIKKPNFHMFRQTNFVSNGGLEWRLKFVRHGLSRNMTLWLLPLSIYGFPMPVGGRIIISLLSQADGFDTIRTESTFEFTPKDDNSKFISSFVTVDNFFKGYVLNKTCELQIELIAIPREDFIQVYSDSDSSENNSGRESSGQPTKEPGMDTDVVEFGMDPIKEPEIGKPENTLELGWRNILPPLDSRTSLFQKTESSAQPTKEPGMDTDVVEFGMDPIKEPEKCFAENTLELGMDTEPENTLEPENTSAQTTKEPGMDTDAVEFGMDPIKEPKKCFAENTLELGIDTEPENTLDLGWRKILPRRHRRTPLFQKTFATYPAFEQEFVKCFNSPEMVDIGRRGCVIDSLGEIFTFLESKTWGDCEIDSESLDLDLGMIEKLTPNLAVFFKPRIEKIKRIAKFLQYRSKIAQLEYELQMYQDEAAKLDDVAQGTDFSSIIGV